MGNQTKGTLRWLLLRIRKRVPALLLLVVSNILGAWLAVTFAVAIQNVIDSAVSGTLEVIIRHAAVLAVFIVLRVVFSGLSIHLMEMLRANLDRDFKQSIIHKILHSEYSEISRYHSSDLVNRMNGDVGSVIAGILALLSSSASLVTSLVTAIVLLAGMAPGFTIAIVAISALIAFFTLLIQKRMKDLHKSASSANGKVSGFFQEIISKLLIVQALDVSDEIENRSNTVLEQRWQIQRKRKNVMLSMNIGTAFLSFVGSFVTLIWCALRLHRGLITFGGLTAMTALIGQLQGPMLTLPTLIPKVVSITAAAERLMEVEAIASQPSASREDADALYGQLTGISLRDVNFRYDRDPVLRDASVLFSKGGLTVITGPSGVGKSTILKLMLAIYKPASGSLVLETGAGEIPVSRHSRALFSYAPQGNLLLSGTLRDNLLLSRPEADEEALRQALYVSAMDEYVATLPQGLDTPLGENGAGLSEGQAQRISLARAVLSDAPILLLDEVTSSLDPQTERTVLERICALPGKTCIAVTHRPAALELARHRVHIEEDGITVSRL